MFFLAFSDRFNFRTFEIFYFPSLVSLFISETEFILRGINFEIHPWCVHPHRAKWYLSSRSDALIWHFLQGVSVTTVTNQFAFRRYSFIIKFLADLFSEKGWLNRRRDE